MGTSSGGGRRGCVSTLLRVQLRCSEDGKARRETTLPYKEPDGKHRRDRATNDGLRATRIDRGTLEMTERQASLSRTPNGLALKEGGDGIAARPATVALSVRQPRPRLDAEDQRSAAGTVPHTHDRSQDRARARPPRRRLCLSARHEPLAKHRASPHAQHDNSQQWITRVRRR